MDYTYDDLGQPSSKTYGNGVTEALTYNIRGRLIGQQVSRGAATLFSTTLRYEDAFGSAGVPSWTGNISSWSWTQAGQGERSYVFGYDGLGRLTTTSQYLNSTLENKYGEDLVYDRNGNITSLVRRNGSSTGQSFSYSYSGNQRSAWEYDSNRNVTSEDPGSESPIVVKYNILNLPAQETIEGDLSAKARYLSDGTKLCIVDADESHGYYHYGPFRRDVPSGTDLNVSVPGGLVWACEDVYTVRYISADHLGSTRLVTDAAGAVMEQYDYLPYGEKCNDTGLSVAKLHKNNYLYTGKELQQYFDIDWYDSFARFQTTSGVFTSPDPLAEKYYSLSPYTYCAGDQVNRIDPEGKNPIVSALLGMAIDYSFQVYENYQKGYSGKEAWINQVDFADVGFSAINPSGKFKTVGTFAVNAAKEFVKVNLNEGFSFEDKNGSVVNVAVNSAIDLAVGKAVDTMEKLANNFSEEAKRALKDATHKRNLSTNRPESTRRASQAMAAESAVQPAIYTAQAYDVIYHVIDDFQEPLRRGISLVYEQKTDKQR